MNTVICNECETVAHCMKNGCVPKVSPKPVVHYVGTPEFWNWNGDITQPVASLPVVLDHPRLGNCYNVRTSVVLREWFDGTIETMNTIYKPYKPLVQESTQS